MSPDTVFDVDQAEFERAVVQRSHEVPVVVDFWAAWCGPCRTLGPLLEDAVSDRGGDVLLAKVDVDANPQLAQTFGVRGIPAVMGFRDGAVAAQFTGAVPRSRIEAFLDELVPSEADRLVATAATQDDETAVRTLEQAIELAPGHRAAAVGLAERIVESDPGRAIELVSPHRPDPGAEAVLARADLVVSADGDEEALRSRVRKDPSDGAAHLQLGRLLAARRDYPGAVEHLLDAVRGGGDTREAAREQLLALFTVLGDDHELVGPARRDLARALF